ncbi:MAG TPA: diaminopimelate epimerase [Pyrinomonadaceae bacterium]|jgi:diaminopimelate epimerase|nr:diaminopimelate epimerase [Pyrinomonadaceae bacterium]
MRFAKLHGYGNDYIVIEANQLAGDGALGEFVRRVCHRHYGAGADGVALIEKQSGGAGDFGVRIFNPDGSEAAMSGNGTRCAAAYLYYQELWSKEELRLSTRAGLKLYRLRERLGEGRYRFEAEIGKPLFESAGIPMLPDEPLPEVRNYPLAVGGGETVSVTALQMCNPNCCVFVDDFETIDWRRLGRIIESHPQFPERTNVEFVRVRDREHIEVRVWERGVGETLSSGTGACASAVAAAFNNLTVRHVRVEMPGGLLEVEWRDDGEVLLTGTAEMVYVGEWIDWKN